MNRPLTESVRSVLEQISDMLRTLTDEQYTRKLPVLSGASLGEHVRHVVEFFLELEQGYFIGYVNYDARRRDRTIEQNREKAVGILDQVAGGLARDNRPLLLEITPDTAGNHCRIATNYEREVAYNLEHTVHHMALIKIGAGAVAAPELPEAFGVAGSTLRYRQSLCAQ